MVQCMLMVEGIRIDIMVLMMFIHNFCTNVEGSRVFWV